MGGIDRKEHFFLGQSDCICCVFRLLSSFFFNISCSALSDHGVVSESA